VTGALFPKVATSKPAEFRVDQRKQFGECALAAEPHFGQQPGHLPGRVGHGSMVNRTVFYITFGFFAPNLS
jgi:hypothetical protein